VKLDRDLAYMRRGSIIVSCVQYAGAAWQAHHHEWALAAFLAFIGLTSIVSSLSPTAQQRTRDQVREWRRELEAARRRAL